MTFFSLRAKGVPERAWEGSAENPEGEPGPFETRTMFETKIWLNWTRFRDWIVQVHETKWHVAWRKPMWRVLIFMEEQKPQRTAALAGHYASLHRRAHLSNSPAYGVLSARFLKYILNRFIFISISILAR